MLYVHEATGHGFLFANEHYFKKHKLASASPSIHLRGHQSRQLQTSSTARFSVISRAQSSGFLLLVWPTRLRSRPYPWMVPRRVRNKPSSQNLGSLKPSALTSDERYINGYFSFRNRQNCRLSTLILGASVSPLRKSFILIFAMSTVLFSPSINRYPRKPSSFSTQNNFFKIRTNGCAWTRTLLKTIIPSRIVRPTCLFPHYMLAVDQDHEGRCPLGYMDPSSMIIQRSDVVTLFDAISERFKLFKGGSYASGGGSIQMKTLWFNLQMPLNRNLQAAQEIWNAAKIYQRNQFADGRVEVFGLSPMQTLEVGQKLLPLNEMQQWQNLRTNDIMTKARSLARSSNRRDLVRAYGYYILRGHMVMSSYHKFLENWTGNHFTSYTETFQRSKPELEVELCSELGILLHKLDHLKEALTAAYVASSLARAVRLHMIRGRFWMRE
jgi:hypothetical protein